MFCIKLDSFFYYNNHRVDLCTCVESATKYKYPYQAKKVFQYLKGRGWADPQIINLSDNK